jgi:N-carbamoyl-L-amino-acid hydrolase
MMFVQSLHSISHNKIDDTKEEHLEMAVTAFDKLADKAMAWISRPACNSRFVIARGSSFMLSDL